MIFNSISKEIAHNYHPNQPSHQSSQTYYPKNTPRKIIDYQVPQRESALAQMNQKITNNIEYLKYKDHIRQKDLHSSRISNSSNHSRRSNQTLHSQNSSRITLNSPSRGSHIQSKKNQHYFPQLIESKLSQKPWYTQPSNHSQTMHTALYQQGSEYRQFLRKPITIDNYNKKYGLNQQYISTNSNKSEHAHNIKYNTNTNINNSMSNHSQRSQIEQYASARPQSQLSEQTFASPTAKDFINTFDNQPKLKQYPKQPAVKSRQSRVVFRQQQQNKINQDITKRSPLEMGSANNDRRAMITAGVLISLGVLLLILQALK